MSFLCVNEPVARALADGSMRIRMPFVVKPEAEAKKKFPRARKARGGAAAAAGGVSEAEAAAAADAEVEIIEDDDAGDSTATQVSAIARHGSPVVDQVLHSYLENGLEGGCVLSASGCMTYSMMH